MRLEFYRLEKENALYTALQLPSSWVSVVRPGLMPISSCNSSLFLLVFQFHSVARKHTLDRRQRWPNDRANKVLILTCVSWKPSPIQSVVRCFGSALHHSHKLLLFFSAPLHRHRHSLTTFQLELIRRREVCSLSESTKSHTLRFFFSISHSYVVAQLSARCSNWTGNFSSIIFRRNSLSAKVLFALLQSNFPLWNFHTPRADFSSRVRSSLVCAESNRTAAHLCTRWLGRDRAEHWDLLVIYFLLCMLGGLCPVDALFAGDDHGWNIDCSCHFEALEGGRLV